MNAAAETTISESSPKVPNYLEAGQTFSSWLFTTDHKRIGILYLLSIMIFFAIAAVAAAMMRIELLTPRGGMLLNETYNKLFTLHGVLMVWFFLILSIPAVLGSLFPYDDWRAQTSLT